MDEADEGALTEALAEKEQRVDPPYIPTIAVDFDGVIHDYYLGWFNKELYGPPIPGAIEGLERLMKIYAVFIFTSRDPDQVARWLADKGFKVTTEVPDVFWSVQGVLLVTQRKLAAVAYIDDRAHLFTTWNDVIQRFDYEGSELRGT
jgi:hypothetical protein